MVGREVLFAIEKPACTHGRRILAVEAGACAINDKGLPVLNGVSLDAPRGEILGVAGVAGNGQRELAEVITGPAPRAESGASQVCDRDVTNCSPLEIIEQGVSHVPEDRLGMGLVPNLPVCDNTALKGYRRPPLSRGPVPAIAPPSRASPSDLMQRFQVSAPGPGHAGPAALRRQPAEDHPGA